MVPKARFVVGVDAAVGEQPFELRCPRSTDRARDRWVAHHRRDDPSASSWSQRSAVRRSCQTIARCRRPAGATVPHDDGLALVGDADRGDRFGRASATAARPSVAGDGLPDLVGVVFDPAGLGEVLGELAVRRAERSSAVRRWRTSRTPVVPASMAMTMAMGPRRTRSGMLLRGRALLMPEHERGERHASRSPDRGRRLPRAERRHPWRRAQGRARPRRRGDRVPRRLAGRASRTD